MQSGFQTPYVNIPKPNIEKPEGRKASYWLEKLFKQERDKEKRIAVAQIQSQALSTDQITSHTGEIEQTSEEKGQEEAVKNYAEKTENNRQVVADMVNSSNRILLKVSSLFPWDFFPNSIIVEETRVTIIHRELFSSQVHSVDIKNISNIFIGTGILFAQLTLVSDTFTQNKIVINRLRKKDAILVRRIIEGLRMFVKENIDTTNYTPRELVSKLKELSTTKIVL